MRGYPVYRVPTGVVGHVTELEHYRTGRQGLDPSDTWQHRSPPEQRGGV
jgi:hypothetical protein